MILVTMEMKAATDTILVYQILYINKVYKNFKKRIQNIQLWKKENYEQYGNGISFHTFKKYR